MNFYKSFFSLFFFCLILLLAVQAQAQVQELQKYIEQGHSFEEICKKADKMVKRHKLEDETYRGEFNAGMHSEDFLDDERVKLERWKWYWRNRLTEDGKFPDLSRRAEMYSSVQNESSGWNTRMVPSWKHEGPVRNTGGYWGMGRTTHIDFHPTQEATFFVASPNGGLWKTSDGGKTYASLTDNIPYQPVGIVIVDQKNPNNIYITLGEKEGWWQYSMGVYKSTDGGKTWSVTGLNWKLTDNRVIYEMEMNPHNNQHLLVASSDGLYQTYNAGKNWTKVRSGNYSSVKFKYGDTATVYLALNDYWGSCEVWRTKDSGKNWSQITNFNAQKGFLRIIVTPTDGEYIAINQSLDGKKQLILSKDGGASFQFVSEMPENLTFIISPKDKQVMYCGYVVLYKSINGGKTWTQISNWYGGTGFPEVHADHHFAQFHPKNLSLYFCCDGGVYNYNESNGQFTELCNGLTISQFYKMAISMSNPPIMAMGSQDNGGFVRRANGSWGNTNGGDAMWQIIDPTNQNIGYTEYWGGTAVYRTTNAFNNLTDITQNIPGKPQGDWVTPFALNPKNPKTFFIGYHDVYVSYNRGDQFTTISRNLTGAEDKDLNNVELSPADTNIVFAAYNNILYSTKNFGKNWRSVTQLGNGEITDIEMHPKEAKRAWTTRGGFNPVKVMVTTDTGATWKNITANFVNIPALCITFDEASNSLFVGTDIGVFYSDADVINWSYYGVGMPNTSVTDLDIHPSTRKMYAATYGRGVYSVDLPDCYPQIVNVQAKISTNEYKNLDTVRLCFGDTLSLRCEQSNLSGQFRWTGPLGLDSVKQNSSILQLGAVNNTSRNGMYVLQYTSNTGCVRTDTIHLRVYTKPNLQLDASSLQLDCHHEEVNIKTKFSAPNDYTHQWYRYGVAIDQTDMIKIKQEGIYTLVSKSKLSQCEASASLNISKFLDPVMNVSSKDVLCYGDSTASLDIRVTEGKAPYDFMVNGKRVNSMISNLPAGEYQIKLIDSNLCVIEQTVMILQPDEIAFQFSYTHSSSNTGKIESMVTGGIPVYTYEWIKESTGEIVSKSSIAEGLEPGFYTLCVVDKNNCKRCKEHLEVKNTTSVNQAKNLDDLALFPNPTQGKITILSKSLDLTKVVLTCFNVQGQEQKVQVLTQSKNEIQVDIMFMPIGSYIIQIQDAEQKFQYPVELIK